MRVVSWNLNQQGPAIWAFLQETLAPDLALVQEAVIPDDIRDRYEVVWVPGWDDGRWGSGILSRVGGLDVVWQGNSRGAALLAASTIPSIGPVSIACVHARVIDQRVIPPLRETLTEIRGRLGLRFIVGGDLNTGRSAALAWPQNGHREFWDEVETWGFHEPLPLGGGERQSFWREWRQNRPPTLGNTLQDDHVFVDAETFGSVSRCLIWDTQQVRRLSDHGPIVVDLSFPEMLDSDIRQ